MEVAEPEKTEGAPPVPVSDSSAPCEPTPAVASEPPAPEGGIAKPAVSMDTITVDPDGGASQPVNNTSLMSVFDVKPYCRCRICREKHLCFLDQLHGSAAQ